MNKILSDYLEKLDSSPLDIKETWVLKFGGIMFQNYIEDDLKDLHFDYPNTEIVYRAENKTETDDIVFKALNDNPNIFDLKYLDDTHYAQFYQNDQGFITSGKMISLKVDIPSRFQKYANKFYTEQTPIEKFNVLVSGTQFVAFAKVPSYPTWSYIGHEIRDLLRMQIEKSSNITVPIFGPSPIHPEIYIIKTKKDEENESSKTNLKMHFNDDKLFIMLFDDESDIDSIVNFIFSHTQSELLNFYKTILTDISVIKQYHTIKDRIVELSIKYKEMVTTPLYKPIKIFTQTRECKKIITKLRVNLLEYDLKFLNYSSIKIKFFQMLVENKYLNGFEDYFSSILSEKIRLPDSFKTTVEHFEFELRASVNTRSVILASILGGIIGSALTFILSLA